MKDNGLCKCGCGKKTALWNRGPHKGKPRSYLKGHGYPTKPDYVVDPATGCWVWQKNLRNGYGRVWREDRLWTAHIWYWEQANGPVPEGMDLDHSCHDPHACDGGNACPHRACVNPAHLVPLPRAANVRRGCLAKLTATEVDAIRATPRYWGSRRDLAIEYNVSPDAIAKIRAGETWA
jgi:hypothetical protein